MVDEEIAGFQAGKVRVRRFAARRNRVSLASLAWFFPATCQGDVEALVSKVRRQKTERPNFLFSTLHAGWRRLFVAAEVVSTRACGANAPPAPQRSRFPPNPDAGKMGGRQSGRRRLTWHIAIP